MKKYHVKFRWFCETCQNFQDKDFFFDTVLSAKRCLSQAVIHLRFDVAFLIYEGRILMTINNYE